MKWILKNAFSRKKLKIVSRYKEKYMGTHGVVEQYIPRGTAEPEGLGCR